MSLANLINGCNDLYQYNNHSTGFTLYRTNFNLCFLRQAFYL